MIGAQRLVMLFFWAIIPSLSVPRSKAPYLVLRQKRNIELLQLLQLRCPGFDNFSVISICFLIDPLFFGVITFQLLLLLVTLSFMHARNTLKLTFTLFVNVSLVVIWWFLIFQAAINLRISLLRAYTLPNSPIFVTT